MADPVRVGEVLVTLPGMTERLAEARLLRAWPDIAGAAAGRTRAQSIEAGVLHVAVDSSGWLHQLTLEEGRLLVRCRGIADVHSIRFHLAALESSAAPDGPEPAGPPDHSTRAEGEVCP